MTNFERIKSLDMDEMTEFISSIDIDGCNGATTIGDNIVLNTIGKIKRWLREEYNEKKW